MSRWEALTAIPLTPTTLAVAVAVGTTYALSRWFKNTKETVGQLHAAKGYRTVRELDLYEVFGCKFESELSSISQTHTNVIVGPLNVTVLRQALVILQRQFAVLRYGIHKDNHGDYYFHEFVTPEDFIDLQVYEREDHLHWQKLSSKLNDKFRPALAEDRLLWRLHFLQNTQPDGPHELIYEAYHTINDGTSRLVFTNALLSICGELINGETPERKEKPWHNGSYTLLFKNGNNRENLDFLANYLPGPLQVVRFVLRFLLEPEVKPNKPLPLAASIKPVEKRRTRFVAWKMSKSLTSKFAGVCKENGVTFNSGFAAATLLAAQRVWNLKAPDYLKIVIPSKLRHMCKPALEEDDLAFCVATKEMPITLIELSKEVFWDYAKLVQKEIHSKETAHDLMLSALNFAYLSKVTGLLTPLLLTDKNAARLGHIGISNLGRLTYPTNFGKVHLDGWYNIDKERILGCYFAHFLATVGGECCGTTEWVHGVVEDEDALAYNKELAKIIEEIAGEEVEILAYPEF